MKRTLMLIPLLALCTTASARADATAGAAGLPLFGDRESASPAKDVNARPEASSTDEAGAASATARGGADETAPLRRRGTAARTNSSAEPAAVTSAGWARTTLSLAAVTGLILLLAWGYRSVMARGVLGTLTRPRKSVSLEVLARAAITPRLGVCAVRFGSRVVLIGVGGERLTALDVISDADAAARFAVEAPGRIPAAPAAADFAALVDESDAQVERVLASADADQRLLRIHGAIRSAAERIRASATGTR
ncbi:MAG: flagellar biosynthetic protein FliO [Phycisphaerales bacterium]|nr:flagellar biosynthetic protein FliO [Phycisphaerales bacterium]